MSIFFEALQTLIDERLTELTGVLTTETKSRGYNHDLSRAQLANISNLRKAILKCSSSEPPNDQADKEKILKLIAESRKLVVKARENEDFPSEEGNTISKLDKITVHISSYYDKLEAMKFKLLNRSYTATPENIVFYWAAIYIGREIFHHKSKDVALRISKEQELDSSLEQFSLILDSPRVQDFESRKAQSLKAIAVIQKFNKDLVTNTTPGLLKYAPKVTLAYIGFDPKDAARSSTGRLKKDFESAQDELEKMTIANYNPNRLYSAHTTEATVASASSVNTMFNNNNRHDSSASTASASSASSFSPAPGGSDEGDD